MEIYTCFEQMRILRYIIKFEDKIDFFVDALELMEDTLILMEK